VWYSRDGKFIKEFGKHGRKPGEFMGPHGLAFDSKGRLFVADRSNNRIQIFDKDMNVVDEWRHFGRPSNIWILKDDTLLVSDSESNQRIGGAADAPEGGLTGGCNASPSGGCLQKFVRKATAGAKRSAASGGGH
jgi:sugar lactone lactonase YvrE